MGKKIKVSLNSAKDVILSEILGQIYYHVPYNVVYVEGTMGIGKSTIFKELRKELMTITGTTWGLIDMRLAAFSASDIQGIPYPVTKKVTNSSGVVEDKMMLQWLKDGSLPGIGDWPKHGILFLDEINQVEDNSVLSLLYQMILDHKINDYVIPEGWYVFCAGNRAEDGGVYNRIPAPVRDRMMILEIVADTEESIEWFRNNKIHPAVISFIEQKKAVNENVLHTYDAELEIDGDEECENYIFTTPRTFEFVSDRLKLQERLVEDRKQALGLRLSTDNILISKLCGLMGEKLGKEFFKFYENVRSFPVADVINAEWRNSLPTIKLPKSPTAQEIYTLLNTVLVSGTQKDLMKMCIYLLYVQANKVSIKLAYEKLTPDTLTQMNQYITVTNSSELNFTAQKLSLGANIDLTK